MNNTESKGTWKEQKIKLKQKFAAITDSDILFEKSKKEEIIAKLQITLGMSKDELDTIFNDL